MSRSLPLALLVGLGTGLAACGQKPPTPGPEASSGSPQGTSVASAASAAAPTAQGERLFVDAQLVDCEGGAGPMKCMRTRASESEEWSLFYDRIEGFEHEAGFAYELRVEKTARPDAPADASSFRYRLLEVLSKRQP